MGLFDNIKKILFEDDEEEETTKSMPVYTDKEEVKEEPKTPEVVKVPEVQPVVEEPIKMNESFNFSNVKRDIDLPFDEKDVLDDIVSNKEIVKEPEVVKQPVLETPVVREEKKSVFLSFDEDEFDRLNSRVNRNEARVRQDIKTNSVPNVEARKANNNFSSTSTSRDNRVDNDRYRISSTPVKKTFTPSPIISPVYGILDKNYTKDDIVDKKDGLKREKIVKPVVKNENVKTIEDAEKEVAKEEIKIEEKPIVVEKTTPVVDIDSVRKKAYGELEDLEKTLTDIQLPELNEVKVLETEEAEEVSIVNEIDTSVEDELDTNFVVENIEIDEEEKELDKVVDEVIEGKEEKTRTKPQLLDDLEKTSTLQILDDIEKELNSIKPISNDIEEDIEIEHVVQKDDTLEKDLFNLIDSMYEEGEEEEDND